MKLSIKNAFLTLEKYLKDVNKSQFEHSCRVAQTSQILAKKWDETILEDAIIASLLHDIGKSISRQQMLNLCSRKNLTLYDFDIFESPVALHDKVSAIIFEEVFDKTDSNRFHCISHAISCHTSGDTNMNLLDKIIFIADNIEPKKRKEILSSIQSGELNSPDECIRIIIEKKIEKANHKNLELNPMLIHTLESIDER